MTGSLGHLVASLVAFLLTHSIPALQPVRARLVLAFSERGYLFIYSLISLAVTTWVVLAFINAPYVELWAITRATMWITVVLMVPACICLSFGLTTPNPFSIPIAPDKFTPETPGVLAITRHPILLGLSLWAIAHITPNGSIAAILVFSSAALFSIAGMFVLDKRRKRTWGEEAWRHFAANTSLLSRPSSTLSWTDWRWGLALIIYGGLIALHPLVIGVSPVP